MMILNLAGTAQVHQSSSIPGHQEPKEGWRRISRRARAWRRGCELDYCYCLFRPLGTRQRTPPRSRRPGARCRIALCQGNGSTGRYCRAGASGLGWPGWLPRQRRTSTLWSRPPPTRRERRATAGRETRRPRRRERPVRSLVSVACRRRRIQRTGTADARSEKDPGIHQALAARRREASHSAALPSDPQLRARDVLALGRPVRFVALRDARGVQPSRNLSRGRLLSASRPGL